MRGLAYNPGILPAEIDPRLRNYRSRYGAISND
ncbi:DUF2737 family protein [Escherichia coli]|nr:DUF2737 family protein [Escherichia coli]